MARGAARAGAAHSAINRPPRRGAGPPPLHPRPHVTTTPPARPLPLAEPRRRGRGSAAAQAHWLPGLSIHENGGKGRGHVVVAQLSGNGGGGGLVLPTPTNPPRPVPAQRHPGTPTPPSCSPRSLSRPPPALGPPALRGYFSPSGCLSPAPGIPSPSGCPVQASGSPSLGNTPISCSAQPQPQGPTAPWGYPSP